MFSLRGYPNRSQVERIPVENFPMRGFSSSRSRKREYSCTALQQKVALEGIHGTPQLKTLSTKHVPNMVRL